MLEHIFTLFNWAYILLLICLSEAIIKVLSDPLLHLNDFLKRWLKNLVVTLTGIGLSYIFKSLDYFYLSFEGQGNYKDKNTFIISTLLSFFFTLYFYDMVVKKVKLIIQNRLEK